MHRLIKSYSKYIGILIIAVLFAPLLILFIRDGAGGAVFEVHDQLDETILNYYFTAHNLWADSFSQMMCGIPSVGLKPFCPIFVPLYAVFNIYHAFLLQYLIVLVTSFYGTYFCVKKLTDNDLSALLSGSLFAALPVHVIYGNVVAGTPLLIYVILELKEEKNVKRKAVLYLLLIYYALSTSLALSGWSVLLMLGLAFIIESFKDHWFRKDLFVSECILLAVYVLCNIDLFMELFGIGSFVSHRVEFSINRPVVPWYKNFFALLTDGDYIYEAESRHIGLIPLILVGACLLIFVKKTRKYAVRFLFCIGLIVFNALMYAFLSSGFVYDIQQKLPGMLKSFGFSRFYYYNVGLWFILFGLSVSIVFELVKEKSEIIGGIIAFAGAFLAFVLIQKGSGIFYQNVMQIVKGAGVSGYVSMRNLYSDDLMDQIDAAIGEDKEIYRVAHIGICPVASLVHGFNTIDGYSNNYPLEYKHKFREIMAGELELNDYNREYFDKWGNRCYIFYHNWGNGFMNSRYFVGSIEDLHLDFDKMKEMNCRYLFTSGPIESPVDYSLEEVGVFDTPESFWRIWVYRIG